MKEKLLYLVLVLMMTVPLCAQNQNAADYTIKGQVVDSLSNETVPYATLSIALANAPQKRSNCWPVMMMESLPPH